MSRFDNYSFARPLILLVILISCSAYFDQRRKDSDCFCRLEGNIDECTCKIDTVDAFNNVKVYPRLRSLITKDYFRYFKVNLKRPCPFWVDDSRCAIKFCHVESCEKNQIPAGLKGAEKWPTGCSTASSKNANVAPICSTAQTEEEVKRYYKNLYEDCKKEQSDLDYLNTTLSAKAQKDLLLWSEHDSVQDNFCILDENDDDTDYVDLLLNPERFTGYSGKSAERVWRSIYLENCFRPDSSDNPYIKSSKLDNMCLEERAFYRAISGLHASINIHLSANYLLSSTSNGVSLLKPQGEWGPNLAEFEKRFSPDTTSGEGPNWLRNLYFIYLVELRAIEKAGPLLEKEGFYTGNEKEDWDTQMAIKDLLKVIKQFPSHFDETKLFTGDTQKKNLKREFREHFRNVSRIMDCVGCDKCKLWGKLQTQGLGTALKILFSGKFDNPKTVKNFRLQRNEIVSLVNAIGRLSNSIYKLDDFKQQLQPTIV